MKRQTKIIIFAFCAAAILGIWVQQKKQSPTTPKTALKVGAILDLSGVSADLGKAVQEGMQIAAEQINNGGGINGKYLEIIYEDAPDQAAKGTINAGQKLIMIDKVKAIIDMPYSGLSALRPLAEQYQTPIVDALDASEQIASFGDWIFSTGVYSTGVGQEVAKFAKDELQMNKIAMLVGKDEYLLSLSEGFEKQIAAQNGQITSREEFLVGEKDFRSQLAKIIKTNPQAIFVAHLGEGGIVVKQAKELGFNGYFLGSDTFSLADVKRAAGSLLNDKVYFALWRNFDALTEQQKHFAESYKQKFSKEAGDYLFYNVLGYDGLMILAEAMKESDLSGPSIKAAIYRIKDFPGLSGPISIDPTGINRDTKSAMVKYGGKIIRYSK